VKVVSTKTHNNWAKFTEEVDEAVPLVGGGQGMKMVVGGSTKIFSADGKLASQNMEGGQSAS